MSGRTSVENGKNRKSGKNGKKREKRYHSMRWELSVIVVSIIAAALIVIGLASAFGLARFYEERKTKRLKSTFSQLNALDADDSESLSDDIRRISEQDNINVTVCDADFSLVASTSRNAEGNAIRMFGFYSGFYMDDIDILEETDTYTLQKTSEKKISTNYLELWGQLDSGYWVLLQTPLQSLEIAADLTVEFYIVVGAIVIVICIFLIRFIMKRYTEPIVQLTDLSKRMANQDFDARYTGDIKNEIGELGESFNTMSEELEHTISELKSANVELQKDNEKKTQIDEVRKEFLNNVSHELKTPIALIQGYAEGLKDNIAGDEESRAFYTDVIIDEANKMNVMVKKLLTLNQLEFGNDPVVMDRFDLTALTKGVIEGMKIMIDEAGARVSFANTEPLYVWGDEFKIEEVLTNYLSNAVHHTEGDRRIEITEELQENGLVRTTVFNTGKPIPEDSIGRVFEKFYKVDKARTREYGGSGIGLSIVKAIMDGHHQKYGVKNYENGVAFWFELEGKS